MLAQERTEREQRWVAWWCRLPRTRLNPPLTLLRHAAALSCPV
jgi:hypothetical protein